MLRDSLPTQRDHTQAPRLDGRPPYDQLLGEERVPAVAHAADLGIVGIAFGR